MKKISLIILALLGFALSSHSQGLTSTVNITQAPCNNDGVFILNISNGTAPYSVTYNFWMIGQQVTHSNIGNSDTFNNWNGSAFSYIITDANGIVGDGGHGQEYPFQAQFSVTNVQCPNTPGAITAFPSGGTAPYTYQYYNVEDSSTIISTSNPAVINDEGYYKVIITDANGCTYTGGGNNSGTIDSGGIFVNSVAPFEFNVTKTLANCTNGTATPGPIVGSGTPPYSYLWSNGATSSTGITGLTMGNYWLTITDANGCHFTRNFEIEQAVNIEVPVTKTDATCLESDGSAVAFGAGGMSPYTYQWSNGQNTQTISNLSSGYYTVVATDANGCIGNGYAYIGASTPITATFTTTASSCTSASGSATLNIIGGTAPYTISWNTFPAQTGITATNLEAGTYGFHITDANGCVRNGAVTIPQQYNVEVAMYASNPTCTATNGSITTMIGGSGSAPYTYEWSTGATSSNLSGVGAGQYFVTVTDANGCSKTAYKNLIATSPIEVGMASTPVTCLYANDGSISANPVGGTAPYSYQWSSSLGTTQSVSNVGAGEYWVTVSDINGCVSNGYTVVTNNETSNSCYCTISGVVYNDANNNCVQDAGEEGIQNIGIHCQGFGYTFTNASGEYVFHVPSGNYIISESVQSFYPLSACQNNSNAINVTAAAGCVQTINFANNINPIHDLKIAIWNNNFAVPGNTYTQEVKIKNFGTVSETTAAAAYKSDGQLGAASFSPGAIFSTAGSDYYTANALPTLLPGQTQTYSVTYNVPTNIPMGTGLVFFDSVAASVPIATNWLTDYSPWNNVNTVNQTVVSSYDPNFIEVSPQGLTENGNIEYKDSILQFRIHFQNSGTYYAQNISILNPLDVNLDWTTLTPGEGSHPFTTFMDENGVVKFQFDNIHLPWESLTEAGSQGYVTYSIKTKNNLPAGTQFFNVANIYFDYNAPITTNQTVNTLIAPTGIDNPKIDALSLNIYPNPNTGNFNLNINCKQATEATIVITDVSGKIVMQDHANLSTGQQVVPMNIGAIAAGVYFVSIKGNAINATQKMIIMK